MVIKTNLGYASDQRLSMLEIFLVRPMDSNHLVDYACNIVDKEPVIGNPRGGRM